MNPRVMAYSDESDNARTREAELALNTSLEDLIFLEKLIDKLTKVC